MTDLHVGNKCSMAIARLRLKPASVNSIQAAGQQLLRQIPDVNGTGWDAEQLVIFSHGAKGGK